jgi:hypothetical protein
VYAQLPKDAAFMAVQAARKMKMGAFTEALTVATSYYHT